MKYDYLIVGAGLFGAAFSFAVSEKGKKCLVIDRRDHIAGNAYTKEESGINVHVYGAHIFHTSIKRSGTLLTVFRNSIITSILP